MIALTRLTRICPCAPIARIQCWVTGWSRPSMGPGLISRSIQVLLALYLLPVLLVVLVIGAVGLLIVGLARIFVRRQGPGAS